MPEERDALTPIERVRLAVATHEAGYEWDVDCDDVKALLDAHDRKAVNRSISHFMEPGPISAGIGRRLSDPWS